MKKSLTYEQINHCVCSPRYQGGPFVHQDRRADGTDHRSPEHSVHPSLTLGQVNCRPSPLLSSETRSTPNPQKQSTVFSSPNHFPVNPRRQHRQHQQDGYVIAYTHASSGAPPRKATSCLGAISSCLQGGAEAREIEPRGSNGRHPRQRQLHQDMSSFSGVIQKNQCSSLLYASGRLGSPS